MKRWLNQHLWWCVVLAWLAAAALGPALEARANRLSLPQMFAAPSLSTVLGTDELGRDILARVALGATVTLPIALAVVVLSLTLGSALGVFAAIVGGAFERTLLRITEVFQAFPGLLLAIALAGVLGPGSGNVVIALCVVSWVGFARLARAQTNIIKTREHVLVATSLGVTPAKIIGRHLLPLLAGPLLVEATFLFGGSIAAEAGMSFLGLGAQPPTPSWGNMLREATQYWLSAPHLLLGPGFAIVSLVLAVQVGAERLRQKWQTPR